MNPEQHRLTTEIAHVLFLDLVGYSRETTQAQGRLPERLRSLLRE